MAAVTDVAPACAKDIELHEYCDGNLDMTVQGVVYHQHRCACPCHPRGLRRVRWEDTLQR